MAVTAKTVIHRWFEEVWNEQREATIHELLAADAPLHGLADSPGQVIRGPAGFLPFWQKFTSAFPNLSIRVDDVVAEGETAAFRCTVTGKHTGKGLGMDPTSADVNFTGMAMARIRDGKILEAWNNFDFLSFQQQIGISKPMLDASAR